MIFNLLIVCPVYESFKAQMVIMTKSGIYIPPTPDFRNKFHNVWIHIEAHTLFLPFSTKNVYDNESMKAGQEWPGVVGC